MDEVESWIAPGTSTMAMVLAEQSRLVRYSPRLLHALVQIASFGRALIISILQPALLKGSCGFKVPGSAVWFTPDPARARADFSAILMLARIKPSAGHYA
jgi:hypothetical protein